VVTDVVPHVDGVISTFSGKIWRPYARQRPRKSSAKGHKNKVVAWHSLRHPLTPGRKTSVCYKGLSLSRERAPLTKADLSQVALFALKFFTVPAFSSRVIPFRDFVRNNLKVCSHNWNADAQNVFRYQEEWRKVVVGTTSGDCWHQQEQCRGADLPQWSVKLQSAGFG